MLIEGGQIQTRRCNACTETKPVTEFHRNGKKGYLSQCKPCRNARQRADRAADPQRFSRYTINYLARTPKAQEKRKQRRRRGRYAGGDPDSKLYTEILLLDPCSYCGGPGGQVDHIDPQADGGQHGWMNLTAACATCNKSKNKRPLLIFLAVRCA